MFTPIALTTARLKARILSFQTSATNFEIITAVEGKGGWSDASAKAVHTLNYFRTTPIQSSLQSKFMRTNK